MDYHLPVMLNECLEGLNINPSGVYADVTFGGGGHSRAILDRLDADGKLFVFDQDADAIENVPSDPRIFFFRSNFRYFAQFLRLAGYPKVDGVLADLGVSSHHFDDAQRGFSYRFDVPLDMRMNVSPNSARRRSCRRLTSGRSLRPTSRSRTSMRTTGAAFRRCSRGSSASTR